MALKRFEYHDADDWGIERNPYANHVFHNDEVIKAQDFLYQYGWLYDTSESGWVGVDTLRAIEKYEEIEGDDFYEKLTVYIDEVLTGE